MKVSKEKSGDAQGLRESLCKNKEALNVLIQQVREMRRLRVLYTIAKIKNQREK